MGENKDILIKYFVIRQILDTYTKDVGVSKCSIQSKIEGMGLRNVVVKRENNIILIELDEKINFTVILKSGSYLDPVEGSKFYDYIDYYHYSHTTKDIINEYSHLKSVIEDIHKIVDELDEDCPDSFAYVDGHCSLYELVTGI